MPVLNEPSVEWKWDLVKTSNLSLITELTSAHNKNLQLVLNQAGTANFWLHLLDETTKYIEELTTSIICYRNGVPIWGGPIFKCNEVAEDKTNQLQVTALGWFKLLERRILHTGKEWEEMKTAWEKATGKVYTPIATESALEIYYNKKSFTEIAKDLIERVNIDYPTGITLGLVPATNNLEFKIPQFHPIAELITQLTSIESGFDFLINPTTKVFNMYWNTIREGTTTMGYGRDRGPGIIFTFPGNCKKVERSSDATKIQNRTEAIGQLNNVGKYPAKNSESSIEELGLFEGSESLSDVVNTDILIAYAGAQTLSLERPLKIITFYPKAFGPSDVVTTSVPRPFEDYEIGDYVYTTIEKGPRFRVGIGTPAPQRVYAMNIEITDNGVEKVNSIQTSYTNV